MGKKNNRALRHQRIDVEVFEQSISLTGTVPWGVDPKSARKRIHSISPPKEQDKRRDVDTAELGKKVIRRNRARHVPFVILSLRHGHMCRSKYLYTRVLSCGANIVVCRLHRYSSRDVCKRDFRPLSCWPG